MFGSLSTIFLIGLMLRKEELRKRADIFTASLCVSDLLASVLFQPFVIRRMLARKPKNAYEWPIRRTIGQATLSASALSLLTASIDRYVVLRWPMRYEPIISKGTALLMVGGIWLGSSAIGTTAYFKRNLSALVFPSILSVIVASIVTTQFSIFIIAKKQVFKIWKHSQPSNKGKKFLANMRATKTIALLLVVFLFSWLPSTIFRFYERSRGGDSVTFHKWLHPLNSLIQIHCSLDACLYVLRNRRFKKEIRKVVKRYLP